MALAHMMDNTAYYILFLKDQLRLRKKKNKAYSLRAFAKDIGIDAGQLSKTLAGKMPLSLRKASRIAESLKSRAEERELFLRSVAENQLSLGRSEHTGDLGTHADEALSEDHLDYDIFLTISDLIHFAILELTYLEDYKSDVRWMARKLKAPVVEVQAAVERLIRIGLLKRQGKGLIKMHKNISTGYQDFSSPALRAHHRQALKQAIASLNRHPHLVRSNHSVTLSIDASKIPMARDMMMKFINELTKVLESGKQTHLYQMSFNLFPLELDL